MQESTTIHSHDLAIEEVSWDVARGLLEPIAPRLVAIIDDLSPSADLVLYKISYPFGLTIIDNGYLNLPMVNGNAVRYNDPSVPKHIVKNLSYSIMSGGPVAVVLDKCLESYLPVENRAFPSKILVPGDIIGTSRILGSIPGSRLSFPNLFSTTEKLVSGVRNLFMMAKISDSVQHNKLKHSYNLKQDCPQSFFDHWSVFKDIARAERLSWRSELLFFPNNWLDKLQDMAWAQLCNCLLYGNKILARIYNTTEWNMIFGYIEQKRKLLYPSYLLDTARHLFNIAASNAPCFRPAVNDSCAPVSALQDAYVKGYGLTEYYPIILEPSYLSASDDEPGYYSLNHATLLQFDIEATAIRKKSIINFLEELRGIIGIYQHMLATNSLAAQSSLGLAARLMKFSFYHNGYDELEKFKHISNESAFFNQDPRFLCNMLGDFPRNSLFLRGCIKMEVFKLNDPQF